MGTRPDPQKRVVGEHDTVIGRQGEVGPGDERPFDLAVGLAELDLGHVPDRRLLDPAGVGHGGRTSTGAPQFGQQAAGVGGQAAVAAYIAGVRWAVRVLSSWAHSLVWWWYMDWIPTRPGPVISATYIPWRIRPVLTLSCTACMVTLESL